MNHRFSFFFRYRYSVRIYGSFLDSAFRFFRRSPLASLLVIIRDATRDAWIARIERMYGITVI